MKEYVLGFAFNKDKTQVVLILKNRPDWQKGKFNGIGGKIEPSDENIHRAMVREFYEETGVVTETQDWNAFAEMLYDDDKLKGPAKVYCFRMFDNCIQQCSTCTDELVQILDLSEVHVHKLRHLLTVLIPLALQTEFSYTVLKQ